MHHTLSLASWNCAIVLIPFFCALASSLSAQLRIKAVGDVLLGSYTPQMYIPPNNGRIFADSIGAYLHGADITFGNFEAAFVREGMKPQKCSEASRRKGVCFEFGVPLTLAPALKHLHFTVMSVDNNHADDYGTEAAQLTLQTLRSYGIEPAPKRGLAELLIRNKRCAVIAFGFSQTSYHIADIATVQRVVHDAKKHYDRIIVSFHGGAEGKNATHTKNKTEVFCGENRGNVVRFAHAAIDAGADLVLGHGPHVLRALEIYNDRFIAYSLGNFLTYGNINIKGISGVACILDVTIDEHSGRFLSGKVIPVVQMPPGIPTYDHNKQAIHMLNELIRQDFPHTPLRVDEDGTIRTAF
ncbi:MAG: CapA family protein [Bacteroidota bacterium]|nr:CapA family protein [Candidatus Kapabacteria bacterium]MDW8219797.1 CapA family protein [Bacteroidota bacterium]